MTVMGDVVIFGRQQNVSAVYSQLESAGFKVGDHYVWNWYRDRYAVRFFDMRNLVMFVLQQDVDETV